MPAFSKLVGRPVLLLLYLRWGTVSVEGGLVVGMLYSLVLAPSKLPKKPKRSQI